MSVITDLAPLLLIVAGLGLVLALLRQPPLLGYLLAGILAASGLLGRPMPTDVITLLGDLGIVLLLFYLGLELSWRKVAGVAGLGLALALVSIALPGLILYNVLLLTGAPGGHAALTAFALSINSTALGVQALEGRGLMQGRMGLLLVGISLCVDVVVIGALAAVGFEGGAHGGAGERVLWFLGFVAACATLGVFIMPRFFDFIHARSNSRLLLPIVLIATGLGVAWAGHRVGVPESVGAFLAGSLAAEARCRRDLEAYLHPVKELFIAFFFVAIGFQITPGALLAALPWALGLGAVMLLTRPVIVSGATWLMNEEGPTALALGAALLPVGEFSFLLVKTAPLPDAHRQLLFALVALVMFGLALVVEPGVALAPRLSRALTKRTPHGTTELLLILRASLGRWLSPYEKRDNPARTALRDLLLTLVVIVGLGVGVAGAAAWLDRVTPRWLNMRDVGRVAIYALLLPLFVVAWQRWQKLLTALFGREHTGPGSERVQRIQRAMRAALSALAAGLGALLLLPFFFGLVGRNRPLLVAAGALLAAGLAWLFRRAIVRLHDQLEGEMWGGGARAAPRPGPPATPGRPKE